MAIGQANSMNVYLVQHVHILEDGLEDVKVIGIYSSQGKAKDAIRRLARLPGFSESNGEFHTDKYETDRDQLVDGFLTISHDE
jgi:hypothetical protein